MRSMLDVQGCFVLNEFIIISFTLLGQTASGRTSPPTFTCIHTIIFVLPYYNNAMIIVLLFPTLIAPPAHLHILHPAVARSFTPEQKSIALKIPASYIFNVSLTLECSNNELLVRHNNNTLHKKQHQHSVCTHPCASIYC